MRAPRSSASGSNCEAAKVHHEHGRFDGEGRDNWDEKVQPGDDKRRYRSGSIDPWRGRWRVRVRVDGKRRLLGLYDTEAEAQDALAAYNALAEPRAIQTSGMTVDQYGQVHLRRKRIRGIRSIDDAINLWKKFIKEDELGGMPLDSVTVNAAEEWLDRALARPIQYQHAHSRNGVLLSRSRIQNGLNVIKGTFDEAVKGGLVASNRFTLLRVPGRPKGKDVHDVSRTVRALDRGFAKASFTISRRRMCTSMTRRRGRAFAMARKAVR